MTGRRQIEQSDFVEEPSKLTILGISGSGRKRSYNTALLEAAKELLPQDATLEVVDVSELPLYNQDLEHDLPETVKELKKKIRGADAILIATPEHNYSVTAVLKNAIEWGNRAAERRFVERQTRGRNQRLNRPPRRRKSTAT